MTDTISIYEIGAGGYWTGRSEVIALTAGCPGGWTRSALPTLTGGQFAVFVAPVWTIAGSPFTPVPIVDPVPESVSPRQAQLALLGAGLLDAVEAAVEEADRPTQISWRSALEYRRFDPVVLGLGAAMDPPLTSEQIDDLFRAAALIP